MDGVTAITQCSIEAQDYFDYEFTAEPAGTHWYHSHHGAQRSDGLHGALIVLPKERTSEYKIRSSIQTSELCLGVTVSLSYISN